MNGLTLTAANSSIFEQKGDKAIKRSLSPDLFRLFEPRAEGRSGDALPVAADEREETLGINSIEQVRLLAKKKAHNFQMCVPLTIALTPALLAASTFTPCRNAILLLSVSPALLLSLYFNKVETRFF